MNIIINGGTRGIGKEVALLFAENKSHKILVTGRSGSILENLEKSALHNNIFTHRIDLEDFDKQAGSFRTAVQNVFHNVDILINCAGMLVTAGFMQFSDDDARRMMQINFFGPALLTRIVRPFMPAGSHIINISSMGGYQGSAKYPGLSYYSASKAALACLSECLSVEFREAGIAVNCLALGSVATEMFEKAFPGHIASFSAVDMAAFIADFAINGNKYFSGRILPVSISNP